MKAIIETGGKQYYVSENDTIYIEKLDAKEEDKITFDKVLMIDGEVGNPYLSKATVTGTVVKQGKNKKIRIYKYVCKEKSSRKRQGHRQPYTKVLITQITR